MQAKKALSHHLYPRASSFYALSNCDVSFQLSQASGEDPPTPFSDRGSEVHEVLAGRESDDPGINEEARALSDLRDQRVRDWLLGPDIPAKVIREKRIWMRHSMKPYYSGQPDEYVVQGRRVFLSDYKTGWHPLDEYTATNAQIRAYVPLVALDLHYEVDEITAAIHKPGKQAPLAVFDKDAIASAQNWAMVVAETAMSKEEKVPRRGAWCKFCSGKVLCPLWKEEVLSLSELSNAIASDVPDSMLRQIAPRLSLAKEVTEKLLDRLYERAKAKPEFFSDWRFVPAVTKRKIDDVIEAYKALVVKEEIMTAGEFLACCRLTISDLERRIRQNRETTYSQTHALLDEMLRGIIEYRTGRDQLFYDPNHEELEQ